MSTWSFSNEHGQTGTLTKNSSGNWSYTPTDSDNPVNEYITQSGGTVTWYQIGEYQNYARYTWPDTVLSGDIVAADGTAVTGFTHNWGHSSLGTGKLTILASSGGGGGTNTEGVVTPSGSLTYRNGTVYITIGSASPTTSTIHKYGIQEDGVWFGLSADTIPHTQGQYTSDSVSGSLGSVYSLKYTNTDGTSSTIALATITATKGSKVFCNFW